MNYEKIYNDLILKRKLFPANGYTEKHHILPKSLYPEFKCFKQNPWNMSVLTAREHFIAHRLLTKFIKTDVWKMHHAIWKMACVGDLKISSRTYEYLRKQHALAVSNNVEANLKKSIANKGRKQSPEHIKARVESRKKKGNWHSLETKAKIGSANQKPNEKLKGRKMPGYAVQRMVEKRIACGNFRTAEQKKVDANIALQQKNSVLTCPHCGFTSTPYGKRQMNRWHFDNCKEFTNVEPNFENRFL